MLCALLPRPTARPLSPNRRVRALPTDATSGHVGIVTECSISLPLEKDLLQDTEMALVVVGPGVGRTGTNSLKLALGRLLGGRCHHTWELDADPERQIGIWTAAIEGRPVDWHEIMDGFPAQV
jgi:Sulfotransferase domain